LKPPTASATETSLTNRRVLVVDDDKLVRTRIADFLRKDGLEVVAVENCLQALETLESSSEPFQFLVTDWELPDGTGIDLIRHVRHAVQSHYMYVVMVTSHNESDNLTTALDAGADDFLAKPIDRGELIARVRSGFRVLDLERRLTYLANYDSLTKLPTRRIFEELMIKEWSRARRYRLPLSCVMLDIDFFKRINDLHGHPGGDEVLREIGAMLAQSVRKSDIICRYGGEEFCIVFPETSLKQAEQWAEKFRQKVSTSDIILDSAVLNVTASLGVAEVLAEMEDYSDLIDLADQCLLKAKEKGRNQVVSVDQFYEQPEGMQHGYIGMLFHGVTAEDAMTPVVATLTPSTSVLEISRFFLEYRIPSAPVVDENGELVGIVSEKDLMAVASQPNPHQVKIEEVMRRNLICYPPDIPLQVVWEFLNRVSIRTVLIGDGKTVHGVISRQSILRWLENSVWRGLGNGATSSEKSGEVQDDSNWPSQRRLERTSQMLADASHRLALEIRQDKSDNSAAVVIGSVTKMQELISEMLSTIGAGRGVFS